MRGTPSFTMLVASTERVKESTILQQSTHWVNKVAVKAEKGILHGVIIENSQSVSLISYSKRFACMHGERK
jgi:hypothetical protein